MIPGVPYTPAMIARLLRDMPTTRLSEVEPRSFQKWPAQQIVKREVIADLIDAERSTRRHAA